MILFRLEFLEQSLKGEDDMNSNSNFDNFISLAFKTLHKLNPLRTSLGVCLGLFFEGISKFFGGDVKKIGKSFYIPTGILILHSKALWRLVVNNKLSEDEIIIDEKVRNMVYTIENSNLKESEKRQQYRNLLEKQLEDIYIKNKEVSTSKSDDAVQSKSDDLATG